MAANQLSQSPYLRILAATTCLSTIGLGINAILRPRTALEMLSFPTPTTPADKKLVDNLMRIYGARNLIMGWSMGVTAYLGHTMALGWIFIGSSVVALVDGFVSKDQIGKGQWNHWQFIMVSVPLGSVLVGAFDRKL
ncbi:hypothetical protein TWF694_005151 [Orbilia ellipsospora]|uniref:Integral membrane protein n=1 Tax=Orbilia ellipsospora TaxID=2528407 RepID=A0AAV9WUS1_9PEZI